MKGLLAEITHDLEKADRGNKAASQRVRTGTIKLEKVAKLYRKESVKFDKQNKGRKKAAPKKGKTTTASKKKAAAPKAKPAAASKKKTAKKTAGSRAMSFQRQRSAKLPRRASW